VEFTSFFRARLYSGSNEDQAPGQGTERTTQFDDPRMTLDVHTLFLVTVYVEAILGLLLLFVWAQNMALRAVCWWGFAYLIRLVSIGLFGMYGKVPDVVSIDLANALLFTAFAATWTGARVFDSRPVEPVYLVTGAVLWLLVCRLPMLADSPDTRALIASGIITAYTWLTAYEFWRGRGENLVSRWPAVFMFFAHGALYILRTPLVAMLPAGAANDTLFASVWMTVLSTESLLLTISSAFILLAMAKERTELRHRTAAMVDPLTGIANRRSFMQDAALAAKQHIADPRPTAVLLIDLDRFKSVNDRFGHAVGDRVLEIFTDAARKSTRGSDLIGRLGGEEFAAMLIDTNREKAIEVAERIRDTFAQMAQEVEGRPVCGTVSIGLVHTAAPALDLAELLAQADQALYCAKERGRNRVEVASLEMMAERATAADAAAAIGVKTTAKSAA
jgi:diguanylate cyclase (GGDEF)-like protein